MHPETIQLIVIYALPVLLAITVHEASHGYIANYLGDNTAYIAGRVTLNPLKHIDFFGTIVVPVMVIMLGGGLFGWAKPVPVNCNALRRTRYDTIWVALAGPLSNGVMALCWTALYRLSIGMDGSFALPLSLMSQAGIQINYFLMFFNLLPILPLDGGRVVMGLLPSRLAYRYAYLESYGMWLLILLIATGLLNLLLSPLVHHAMMLTSSLFFNTAPL